MTDNKDRTDKNSDEHSFGGKWTEDKLKVLEKYLNAYVQALKNFNFNKLYIDAFAGSGQRLDSRTQKLNQDNAEFLFDDLRNEDTNALFDGSTRIALKINPSFDEYIFIEKDPQRCRQLESLKTEFAPSRKQIQIQRGDANSEIKKICQSTDWINTRAVLFLDPYGLEVDWDTIDAIAQTRAIDLWLLFPLSGLNRQLRKDGKIEEGTRQRIDRFLGTAEWYDAIYRDSGQADLFDPQEPKIRKANLTEIGAFVKNRLEATFPAVSSTLGILRNSTNSPLFLFCFAAANERGGPIAKKIANHLLKGLE